MQVKGCLFQKSFLAVSSHTADVKLKHVNKVNKFVFLQQIYLAVKLSATVSFSLYTDTRQFLQQEVITPQTPSLLLSHC